MKYITKLYFLLFLTSFIYTPYVISQSNDIARIAVIGDKDISSLAALLDVELSQRDDVQLLERAAIDRILEEQQLSAAGLLDRNNTIKIGKLLRADAFIILSTEKSTPESNNVSPNQASGDLIRVRVSETAHGLRLLDYFAQSDSNSVGSIVQKLESVLNKISQPDEKLIPVGIVDIHRVQLAEQYKMLERTLPVLLSVRLNLEPQIIMLEREDLKVLLDEKLMTEGEDTDFWSSAILIDGYIQPNNGQLEMHLNLKQAAGENLKSIIVPVEPNEPSKAIVKATTEITQQLQNSPPTVKWQPEQEAEQFYNQGRMLLLHSRYEKIMSFFEIAHSLQPENVLYTGAVFGTEMRARQHYSDLELANLVTVLIKQIRDAYDNDLVTINQIMKNWGYSLGLNSANGYFVDPISVSSEQIKQINRKNRKILIETCDKALKKQVINPDYGPIMNHVWRVRFALISSDDPNELLDNIKKSFNEFIMPPELGGKIKSDQERNYIYDQAIRYFFPISRTYKYLKDSRNIFINLLRDYLTELTDINDPIVQFNSYLSLCELTKQKQDNVKEKYYTSKALAILAEQLQKHNEGFSQIQVSRMKKAINDIFTSSSINNDKSNIVNIWIQIYSPLIDSKDADTLALWDPGSSIERVDTGRSFELNKQWYDVLERIKNIFESKEDDKKIQKPLINIRGLQAQIRSTFPQLYPSALNHPIAQMLLKQEDWYVPIDFIMNPSLNNLIQVKQQDKMLWVSFISIPVFLRTRSNNIVQLGLAGIDMEKRELVSLWQADVSTSLLNTEIIPEITDLEISDDVIYVSVKNAGIVEFPGSIMKNREHITTPNIYTQKDGLPSILISSMIRDGDKLWIAYGDTGLESGLGIYHPNTKNWESIFCSTINGDEPFNAGWFYKIQYMRFTKSDQIYFILHDASNGQSKIADWIGLWKINTNTYKPEPVIIGNIFKKSGNIVLNEFQKKWWIGKENSSPIIEFDPVTEKSRILEVGESTQNAQTFDNNILGGSTVYKFVSTPYGLVGIGEGTVGLIETEKMEK